MADTASKEKSENSSASSATSSGDNQEDELKAMEEMFKAVKELQEQFTKAAMGVLTSALGPMNDLNPMPANADYDKAASSQNKKQSGGGDSSDKLDKVVGIATKIAPLVM